VSGEGVAEELAPAAELDRARAREKQSSCLLTEGERRVRACIRRAGERRHRKKEEGGKSHLKEGGGHGMLFRHGVLQLEGVHLLLRESEEEPPPRDRLRP